MVYELDLRRLKDKRIYPLGEEFRGVSEEGRNSHLRIITCKRTENHSLVSAGNFIIPGCQTQDGKTNLSR